MLIGAQLEDKLFGGRGDDVLDGGLGNDYLEGGQGLDTYLIEDSDTIFDSDGLGRIQFKNGLLDIKRSLSCNCLPIQPILAGI